MIGISFERESQTAPETTIAQPDSLGTRVSDHPEHVRVWDELIDRKLIEWGRDLRALEDDGIIPPSRQTLALATQLAIRWRDDGVMPPNRVVPDGDGGISFERWRGDDFQSIDILGDLTVFLTTFHQAQLIRRTQLR